MTLTNLILQMRYIWTLLVWLTLVYNTDGHEKHPLPILDSPNSWFACEICGFHANDYENYYLLECETM